MNDETNYNEIVLKATTYENSLKTNSNNWVKINFSDIKLGDKIIIHFNPFSQLYIYSLYPKFGEVVLILPILELTNDYSIQELTLERLTLKYDDLEFNADHDWCSYYGDSRGFYYDILRLEN